jgi:LmbE family N-acetylglucosaminyl deacetylase
MNQTFEPLAPSIVLAVGAHPDDMDFGAGGSLALFAAQGAQVHYLQVTDGSKGTDDTHITCEALMKKREQEQRDACQALGGTDVHFLRYRDGELEVTAQLKKDIVRVIRTIKPDVVITPDPSELYSPSMGMVNHSDHRATGLATMDAVYPLARDHLNYPDQIEEGLQPHKVKTLLFTNFERQNFYVDISTTLQTKLQAIAAHASQIDDMDSARDMFTNFAANTGKRAGYEYAEGFMRLDIAI